jgi:hypothetical protein
MQLWSAISGLLGAVLEVVGGLMTAGGLFNYRWYQMPRIMFRLFTDRSFAATLSYVNESNKPDPRVAKGFGLIAIGFLLTGFGQILSICAAARG